MIGSVDEAKLGMGGVLFTPGHPAMLWQTTFPADIQQCIISMDNPLGDLTNSGLKQAGGLAQVDMAAFLYYF